MIFSKPLQLPSAAQALPGRDQAVPVPQRHFVNGNPIMPPLPEGIESAVDRKSVV